MKNKMDLKSSLGLLSKFYETYVTTVNDHCSGGFVNQRFWQGAKVKAMNIAIGY